jgi:hypothetical protein
VRGPTCASTSDVCGNCAAHSCAATGDLQSNCGAPACAARMILVRTVVLLPVLL